MTAALSAPSAPGRLGDALEPALISDYLIELGDWLRGRRTELDVLDQAALAAGTGGAVASDMSLALALWKVISARYKLMVAVWDGGRVLDKERAEISALIWGRIDGAAEIPGGLAVTVPEAGRLCDALTHQLRTRVALTPGADAAAADIRDLRAQFERIRDQVALEPVTTRDAAVARLAGLMARLDEISARAQRGADVGGLIPALEADGATLERDLIVGNARRRDAREQILAVRALRSDLERRGIELRDLASTCVATVDPAPNNAVPEVSALGPVPVTPEEIDPYRQRLDRVAQAMDVAHLKYSSALAEHTQLVGLLDAYVAKAEAVGVAAAPDVARAEQQARELLDRRPAPMVLARQLVTTYQTWIAKEFS